MKKLILLVVLLLTFSFAFATNEVETVSTLNVEETLSVEFTEVDLIKINANNNIEVVADCFGEAIAVLEQFEENHGSTTDDEATYILNMAYAICWLFEQ